MLALFLTSCANSGTVQSEDSSAVSADNVSPDSGSESAETASFSREELDLIRLNSEQSNYSNSVNLKSSASGKMCYVEETNTIFFSDRNGLFQQTGEKTSKLLDTPVSALNIADGKLYFIISENEMAGYECGRAYCMDLSNGKTECIIDEEITNMFVYKDRIFYQKISNYTEREGGVISYSMPMLRCGLNGEERTNSSYFKIAFDNDLFIAYEDDSINIIDSEDGTPGEALFDDSDYWLKNISLYNGSLYYIRVDYSTLHEVLIRMNLSDKTVEEFRIMGDYFEDYGFIGGKLFAYNLVDLYLEEDGKLTKYIGTERTYDGIYSCGGKAYGISGGRIFEIGFYDDRGIKEVSETEIGGVVNEN